MRYDFFICHASKDKETYVKYLKLILDDIGATYWVDSVEISWGNNIENRINHGIKGSKFVILVITKYFLESKWTEYEISKSTEYGAILLPIIIGNDIEKEAYKKFPTVESNKALKTNFDSTEFIKKEIENKIHEFNEPYNSYLTNIERIKVIKDFNFSIKFGEGMHLEEIGFKNQVIMNQDTKLPRTNRYCIKSLVENRFQELNHVPRCITICGEIKDKNIKSVAAYVCTDTYYFQDCQVLSAGNFELTCLIDRGGIAAFVSADNGALNNEDDFSLGNGYGAIAALVILAFDAKSEPQYRTCYVVVVREGIRYPDDIWLSSRTNRPITNNLANEPLIDSRFVFQSRQPNGNSSDIFTADFTGSNMHNITKKHETAYDGFLDENNQEVIKWLDKSTLQYSSRKDGVIRIRNSKDNYSTPT